MSNLQITAGFPLIMNNTDLVLFQPSLREVARLGEDIFFQSVNFLSLEKEEIEKIVGMEIGQKTIYEIKKELFKVDEGAKGLIMVGLATFTKGEVKYSEGLDTFTIALNGKIEIVTDELYEEIQRGVRLLMEDDASREEKFKPTDKKSESIANKIEQSRSRLSQESKNKNRGATLDRLIKALCTLDHSLNLLNVWDLTMRQFNDSLKSHMLYENYKIQIQSALAGAEVKIEDWIEQI